MDSFEISVLTFSVKGVGFYGVTVAALAAGVFGIGWLIFVLRGFGHWNSPGAAVARIILRGLKSPAPRPDTARRPEAGACAEDCPSDQSGDRQGPENSPGELEDSRITGPKL